MGNWVDVPVRDIIAYFVNTLGWFTSVALRLARIMALLGIVWGAIQMAFGTLQARKFVTDYFTKFIFFLLIMSFYPGFTRGLKTFALNLGVGASSTSVSTLTQALADYLHDLEKLEDNLDDIIATQEALITNYQQQLRAAAGTYKAEDIALQLLNAEKELEKVKRKKGKSENSGVKKKINAIKSILITDSGKNRAKSYRMDLDMKDAYGKSLGYISPDALARISLLAGQIMWENEWAFDVIAKSEHKDIADMSEAEKEELRTSSVDGTKKIPFYKFPIGAIWNIGMVFICIIALYLTTAGCLIQYIMAIVEYFISSSYSIVLVPLMLFEGLKDMANKVLPMLFAQAVKLSMITMCMLFNTMAYLKMAMTMTTTATAFQWSDLFYVIFTSFLTFALTVNAPKLAVTILTGQPQMSMGEFVQTASAAIMGTRMASQAVSSGMAAAKAGTQGALRQGANRFGDAAAMLGSAERAFDDGRGVFGAMGAAGTTLMSRTGKRMGANLNSFVHGSGGRGGGGASGGTAAGGVSNRMNAGGAHQNERLNSEKPLSVPNALDANGNPVSQRFADTAAMNYADAKYNDGKQYTGSMSFMDYLKTQYNSAYGIKEEGSGGSTAGSLPPRNLPPPASLPPSQGRNLPPPTHARVPIYPRPPVLSGGNVLVPEAIKKRKPGTVSNVRFTGDLDAIRSANRRLPKFDTLHKADKTT